MSASNPGSGPKPGIGASVDEELAGLQYDMVRRRWAGGIAACVAVAGVIAIVVYACFELHALACVHDAKNLPGNQWQLTYHLSLLATHAIVSVAAVYFCYQLLRAAERLWIPGAMVRPDANVETLRALLGIEEPVRRAMRIMEAFGTGTAKAAGAATSATQAVREAVGGGSEHSK